MVLPCKVLLGKGGVSKEIMPGYYSATIELYTLSNVIS